MRTRTKKPETTVISLRLTPKELKTVRTVAKDSDLSVSEFIRQRILKGGAQ